MSDPRFARLKTDPRFRRIKKDKNKVVVDERFEGIFDDRVHTKRKNGKARVDKYGRPLADDHDQKTLRRFYRLGHEDEDESLLEFKTGPDYARGEVLLESSDEGDGDFAGAQSDEESDSGGVITLGRDVTQPIPVPDDFAEVDLDEDNFADLDAQAAAYAEANPESKSQAQRTRRLAVVNLDWDHVRAVHLYKIFSSLVSPTGASFASSSKNPGLARSASTSTVRGRVLRVRVHPSQFGKERMAREEKEGPPPEVFKQKPDLKPEDVNERTVYELGEGEDYDDHALRKYQLERLRYYYAIVECDSVEAASHIFDELDGTELERSANVFDLSFVPDDMMFEDDFRDEAKDDLNAPYKPLEFVTDALRHSKVKLTWDEDEPERAQVTRRVFTRKELEENDFRVYIASSSESESEDAPGASTSKTMGKESNSKDLKRSQRDRLRALLLGGGNEDMPEGWGQCDDEQGDDVDMEVTFTPGLSASKNDQQETTLERYQRRMREKKKKRKEELRDRAKEHTDEGKAVKKGIDDDFFGANSDGDDSTAVAEDELVKAPRKKGKGKRVDDEQLPARVESTAEELALLAASDSTKGEVRHFDMKAVLRAEKKGGRRTKKGKTVRKGPDDGENEVQEDFAIDVKDERFKSVLEDHTFAIDPSNPHFKKTKSMTALMGERSRRQQERISREHESVVLKNAEVQQPNLQSLVESIKRKSAVSNGAGTGKRRKLA